MTNKTKRILIAIAIMATGSAVLATSVTSCSNTTQQQAAKDAAAKKTSDAENAALLSGFSSSAPPKIKHTSANDNFAPWGGAPKKEKHHE